MDLKYQRIKVIGRGSFGKAYLVKNTEDDTECVVKQMETSSMDPKDRNEAVKEALFMKKMEHPNIIRFFEVFMTKKGRLCIVMEYADGGDLHSEIKKQEGRLMPEDRIFSWFVQTCLALHHVHQKKVLHRDLKTQNIFLMATGQIKLGDFGIAKVLEATKDYAKTLVGTPYYLSPEIIQELPYAYKSDVWSCGVVLYEMASLRHPFNAENLAQLAGKILRDETPPIDGRYSSEMVDLIKLMLRKDAQDRPYFSKVLSMEFLHPAMRAANEEFRLGLDLAQFFSAAKLAEPDDLDPPTPVTRDYSASEEGAGGAFADGSDSEPDEAGGPALAKSVSALQLAPGFAAKANGLRSYLKEQTSEAEFTQVQTLLNTAAMDDQSNVEWKIIEILGVSKATPLLPMFHLLRFLEDMAERDKEKQKENILQTFRTWDLNGDDLISREELQQVLRQLGISDADIEAIFVAADTNTDGKIDYTEFIEWLYSGSALTAFKKQAGPSN